MLLLSLARAATLHVDPSGGAGTFPTVAEAVAVAISGDTVELVAGTYEEAIDPAGKDLTFIGVDGSGATVLTGGSAGAALLITSGEARVTLSGLTFQPADGPTGRIDTGEVSLSDVVFDGGSDAVAVEVRGATVVGHEVTFRGAAGTNLVLVDGAAVTLSASEITAGGDGGVVMLDEGTPSTLTLSTTSVSDNTSVGHAAGVEVGGNTLSSWACLFFHDDAYEADGGAVHVAGAWTSFADTLMLNSASSSGHDAVGGAIALADGARVELTAPWLEENRADYGGGIGAESTALTLAGGEFEGNTAGRGGALYVVDGDLTVADAIFTANEAVSGGGAVYMVTGLLVVERSTFDSNLATTGTGGGILVYDPQAGTTVAQSSFTGNQGTSGGAIRVQGGTTAADVTLRADTFTDNIATTGDGGGVFAQGDVMGDGESVLVDGCTFVGNAAYWDGGGVEVQSFSTIAVQDSVFYENASTKPGSGGGGGLMLFSTGSEGFEILRNRFCGNVSEVGGGLLLESAARRTLVANNTFWDNYAGTNGGGASLSSGSTRLENNTWVANDAGRGGGAVATSSVVVRSRNDIYAWTRSSSAIDLSTGPAGRASSFYYADLYANLGADFSRFTRFSASSTGNQAADPGFAGWSDDGDCTNDDFTLLAGSPMIDAGDPGRRDPDGSASDLGATGGPYADPHLSRTDLDGDGFRVPDDCDDADAGANPGAAEVCDGVDNDCDGRVDERDMGGPPLDGSVVWYADVDGDSYGSRAGATRACSAPAGFVSNPADCDDADAAVSPAATEVANGVDDDCDGRVDEA